MYGKELFKVGRSEVGTSRLAGYHGGGNKIKKIVVWARVKKVIESERFFISWFGDRFDVLRDSREFFLVPPAQVNIALSIAVLLNTLRWVARGAGSATPRSALRDFPPTLETLPISG